VAECFHKVGLNPDVNVNNEHRICASIERARDDGIRPKNQW
jgi:hypothetical protein